MQILKNPLSSWLVAITLFSILPLAQHINGGLLSAGITSNPSDRKPLALLITGSGLHCALKNVDEYGLHPTVDIQSLYLPLASIWSFESIERTLTKVDPDILVLQSSMLANNNKTSSARAWLRQLKQYWIGQLSTIHPQLETLMVNLQCELDSLDRDKWMHWLEIAIAEKKNHAENIPQQVEFLKRLIHYKKPIIIVNQPHPGLAQNFKSTLLESIDHITSAADANDSITRINYTSVHPETLFYDPFHPKPELSTIFTRWFHSELSRHLEE